jgi:hypothetical protein
MGEGPGASTWARSQGIDARQRPGGNKIRNNRRVLRGQRDDRRDAREQQYQQDRDDIYVFELMNQLLLRALWI